MCQLFAQHIGVDIIYNLIMDVPLFHTLHIINGDICGMQHEIMEKRLSTISTVSKYELSSTTKN